LYLARIEKIASAGACGTALNNEAGSFYHLKILKSKAKRYL